MESSNMQATKGKTYLDQLIASPNEFDFFQAVRLLQKNDKNKKVLTANGCIGTSSHPKQETVRFHSLPSLSAPANSIHQISQEANASYAMMVSFWGLTGPAGVLPNHYTERLITRRHQKDTAMHDFFDLFTHRTLSLFYRAWEKYRFYMKYERTRASTTNDSLSKILKALIGIGTLGLSPRLNIPEDSLLFHASAFSRLPRSACTLENMLTDYFRLPMTVEQFQGSWLCLDDNQRSRLSKLDTGQCSYSELGVNTVLGAKTWDRQSKFRIVIGPLTADQFDQLLPKGEMIKPLVQLIRFYVGATLSFDLQLMLRADEVPYCRLSPQKPKQLGWNTWLKTKPFTQDARDTLISPVTFE